MMSESPHGGRWQRETLYRWDVSARHGKEQLIFYRHKNIRQRRPYFLFFVFYSSAKYLLKYGIQFSISIISVISLSSSCFIHTYSQHLFMHRCRYRCSISVRLSSGLWLGHCYIWILFFFGYSAYICYCDWDRCPVASPSFSQVSYFGQIPYIWIFW